MVLMTKTDVLKSLDKQFPDKELLSVADVQAFLGLRATACRDFLVGLPYARFGTRKRFLKEAIAERVAERKEA